MTRITREQFISDFKRDGSDVAIDVNNLTPANQEKLKQAGLTRRDLAKIAGDDGKISGDEYNALYNKVDSFEKNNSSTEYFDTTDAKNAPTVSGEVYEALKSQLDFNVAKSILRGPNPSKANTNSSAEGPEVSLFDGEKGGRAKKGGHTLGHKDRLQLQAKYKERLQTIKKELKANGYSFDKEGLQKAVKKQDVNAIKLFLYQDFSNTTFLSMVEKGDTKAVQAFLDAGLDPNIIRDKYERTPLMLAGNAETVDKLLAKGADVTAKDINGKTALMYQAQTSAGLSSEFRKAVLEANAIDATDNFGKTALMYAAIGNNTPTIDQLIIDHATVDKVDNGGSTALTYAVENDNLAAAKKLMEHGASANGDYAEGRDVPLNIAIKNGYGDMIDALLDNPYIDPHLPDYDGKTSFDYAIERRDQDLLNQLNRKHDEIMEVHEAMIEIAAKRRAQTNGNPNP